ncbi:SDR family oxidoreductase [Nakamurella flavida]|uniref:SDR family oxidoreductase n=1 Tax=Nakamurella flavida TaxID=363630 RepID=A0A939C1C9_9ACTN|nr:SDR family oxidoreductase [Nakamurella flavida]MBM9475335.1 SDR family oxidoreductase [Nakamurella flavida]MDP9776909.1 NAD(P)-dependent dehydrogenase (short-subunit alcohol dehydrogenase family) [Nakamurella flavida]
MSSLLVTGGSGGIGGAVADLARAQGRRVDVLDLSVGVDCSDPDAVEAYLDSIPTPTHVVHVAGVVGAGGIESIDLLEWERVMRHNLTSAYVVSRAVLPRMVTAGGGAMVLMSSLNARDGGTELSGAAYAAAKAGVLGLMRHLAVHYGPRGVRVNAVAPGPVRTAMHDRLNAEQRAWLLSRMPLPRVSEATEVAEVMLFLLSDACASVTGMTFDINGGSHLS